MGGKNKIFIQGSMKNFRPTLDTHVPSLTRGLAIKAHATTATLPSLTDDYDGQLAALRAHLQPGPQQRGHCALCGEQSPTSGTCGDCKKLLARELVLLKRRHGPPPEDRRCPVCRHTSSKTLHLDHHHGTGVARGYICNRCNAAVGLYDRSPGAFEVRLRQLGG